MACCPGGFLTTVAACIVYLPTTLGDLPLILWWADMGNVDSIRTCGHVECEITINKSRTEGQRVMAFIFDGTHFGEDGFPFPRRPDHLWGLHMNESPKNNDWLMNYEEVITLFNYTSTFRRESHVPFPLQWLEGSDTLTDRTYFVEISEKSRMRKEEGLAAILFVHSDCSTPSGREGYMKMLQKHIQIDSYGSCENNKRFPNISDVDGMGGMMTPNFLKLVAKYKFAFAFENAVCPDYMTEKLWRPLQVGTIPIVFGSPRVKDYLPSNQSAIVIDDFPDVRAVADRIRFLDEHDKEYDMYREFKTRGIQNQFLLDTLKHREGNGVMHASTFRNFECFLCKKLHELLHAEKSDVHFERSQGGITHFGCPEPSAFDDEGRYKVKGRSGVFNKAKYRAKAIKYFHDINVNATLDQINEQARYFERLHEEL